MRARRDLLLLALLALPACSAEGPVSRQAEPDTLLPRLDRQWGTLQGDESAFTRVSSFAVAEDGGLFVSDAGRGIQVFSPEGAFVRTLAREGEGPGETRFARAMDYGAGLLAAWDAGNKRIYIWNRDLELIHTRPTPRFWNAYDESAVNVLDNGEVWVKLVPDQGSDGVDFPRPEYLRVWPDATDTLYVGPGGGSCDKPYDFAYRNGFWRDLRDPWFPSTITALGSSGELYLGCNDDFRFLRIVDGDTATFARPNLDPVIPDDERRFFETAWVPPIGTMPEFRPEYSRIVPGGDGKVWVFETSPAQPVEVSAEIAAMSGFDEVLGVADRGGRFSVFDEGGSLIAIVPLPDDVRYSGFPTTASVVIRGDTIWAVRTGSFEEQYVARYVVPFE